MKIIKYYTFVFFSFMFLLNQSCSKEELDWTLDPIRPKIETISASNITGTSAVLQAKVVHNGGKEITQQGFCYGLQTNPTVNSNNVLKTAGEIGLFSMVLSGLIENTTYYIRSYAINEIGVGYGNEIKISTGQLPKVETIGVTNISPYSAKISGKVVNDGGKSIIERGFYVSKTINTSNYDLSLLHPQNIVGTYESDVIGLLPQTLYYYRAYVKTSNGIALGEWKSFTTLNPNCIPTISTIQPTNITPSSFNTGGNISNDGGQIITERGMVWGTNLLPTVTSGNKSNNGVGLGQFATTISGLSPNKNYYVRAYATNICGTQYGNQFTVTTTSCLPSVTTTNISNISSNSATGGGTVSSDSNFPITSRGVVWSLSPGPTVNLSTKTTNGSGNGSFASNLVNLISNRTYYVRAYATNSCGTTYGQEVVFNSANCQVTLETISPYSITTSSAISGGTILSIEGGSITSKGVVWSTSSNPVIALSTKTNEGSGSGSFTSNITNLTSNTNYYVRAYATNNCGTFYGPEEYFTTGGSVNKDVIIGSSSNTTNDEDVTPFATYYSDAKHIYLYKASELLSQGAKSGIIDAVGIRILNPSNITVNNFRLRIGTTSSTELSTSISYTFSQQVNYNPFNLYAGFDSGDWVLMPMATQPFFWDGSKNIILELCFDNSSYNTNTSVYYSSTNFYSTLATSTDDSIGCSLSLTTRGYNRPNTRFRFQ